MRTVVRVFVASALLGFLFGIAFLAIANLSVLVVERSPSYWGWDWSNLAQLFGFWGLVWAAIISIIFGAMWIVLKPKAPLWPLLARVALAAFLVEACVYFAFDHLATRLSLTSTIDDNILSVIKIAIGIVPIVLTAYVGMRSFETRPFHSLRSLRRAPQDDTSY